MLVANWTSLLKKACKENWDCEPGVDIGVEGRTDVEVGVAAGGVATQA